jgi:hypothetical protein
MSLLSNLSLDDLTPAALWLALDPETRRLAASSLYRGQWDDPAGRREADNAIAEAIHFRSAAVRKLPVEKRIDYLLRAVRPDDSLARSLLLALHLDKRKGLLETFLDHLEIPQEGGMIDADFDLQPPATDRLSGAVEKLREVHPSGEVDIYLISLLAMEPETWGGLEELIGEADSG